MLLIRSGGKSNLKFYCPKEFPKKIFLEFHYLEFNPLHPSKSSDYQAFKRLFVKENYENKKAPEDSDEHIPL